MSRLAELGEYKNTILLKLINNDNLVRAVNNPESDFLTNPVADPSSIIYSNLFPYKFVPDIQSGEKTFITMMFSDFQLVNTVYKSGCIWFYVFTHKNLMKTDYGILRSDYIINQIDEVMNQSRELGIGKLQFEGMSDFSVSEDYLGGWIKYKNYDFN